MSTPAIHPTNSPRAAPLAWAQNIWENLTGALTSRYSTRFKILGLVATFGLLYCAWSICSSRAVKKSNHKPLPSVPTTENPQRETTALPDGIEQAQVDEIVKVLTERFRSIQQQQALEAQYQQTLKTYTPTEPRDPTQPTIWLGELEKTCKGEVPERNTSKDALQQLCTYLQEQKIITSYIPTRGSNYQFTLHEEFIQKLKNTATT